MTFDYVTSLRRSVFDGFSYAGPGTVIEKPLHGNGGLNPERLSTRLPLQSGVATAAALGAVVMPG
jgi:hypothetical protein